MPSIAEMKTVAILSRKAELREAPIFFSKTADFLQFGLPGRLPYPAAAQ
jgi:hypothetical protein